MARRILLLITALTLAAGFYFQDAFSGPLQEKDAAEEKKESPPQEDEGIIGELKLFSKAIGAILEAYPADLQARQMLYEAVKGMVASLDRYCEFIEPSRYELLKIHMHGEYAGIGIILESKDHFPAVREVQPGSPAQKAGLEAGDQILNINKVSMENKELMEVSGLLRGEAKESVALHLWRESAQRHLDVKIKREMIQVQSVEDVKMIAKAIGYLKIVTFHEHTAEQVRKEIHQLGKKGMRGLIIDLRNNDGGLMPQAVELAEMFLAEGRRIVSVESKIEEQRKEYVSSGKKMLPYYRLVILVNGQSASASEIFSAAMQENGRATIVGTQTYGKGSVQSVIPLDDKSAMKLTTARYLSPQGRKIDGVGIAPDVVLEASVEPGQTFDPYLVKSLLILSEAGKAEIPKN